MIDFKIVRSIVAAGICHTHDCERCQGYFDVDSCPIHDCDDDTKVALLKKLYERALSVTENISWSDEEFMRLLNDEN